MKNVVFQPWKSQLYFLKLAFVKLCYTMYTYYYTILYTIYYAILKPVDGLAKNFFGDFQGRKTTFFIIYFQVRSVLTGFGKKKNNFFRRGTGRYS